MMNDIIHPNSVGFSLYFINIFLKENNINRMCSFKSEFLKFSAVSLKKRIDLELFETFLQSLVGSI